LPPPPAGSGREAEAAAALRGAVAGAVAALLWAGQQPLDKRLFRSDYDDLELLGKLFTRKRAWLPLGLALHTANGALFGAAFTVVKPAIPGPPVARGLAAALAENFGLWPAGRMSDRFHPARRELPELTGNRRAFAQATWRHALFGVVLGVLEDRLNRSNLSPA
jgi:hypothetical protein